MGYLDSDTITVDAILTKKGRQIISQGGGLNITTFTLSDTGVDYTLWNADHPSGSAYYGEAIEDLPQTEALTNSQYAIRNKLVSLGKDTIAMPALEVEPSGPQFTILSPKTLSIQLLGYTPAVGSTGQAGLHLLIPDINIAYSSTGNAIDITGNALSFISEADIPSARLYELIGSGPTYSFEIHPLGNLDVQKTITLTFIDILTGAYVTAQVTVDADLQPQARVVTTPKG